MRRRLTLALALLALLLVAGSAAGDPGDDKERIDEKLGALRGRISEALARESVLSEEISSATARIRTLQAEVAQEEQRLAGIEARLESERDRLAELTALLREQTEQLRLFRAQHARATRRLERRVRELYMTDTPDAFSFVLNVSSFGDLIDNVEFLNRIGRQDDRIVQEVEHARDVAARVRAETTRTRAEQERTTAAVAARYEEQRATRDRLLASHDALASARADKRETLSGIRARKADWIAEAEELARESARLAAAIQAAQASGPSVSIGSGVSASGLAWPVSGPVTSGFGWRWGRMHEGIDIAVPSGTPVQASASGQVIVSGWMGGYGYLVVVDHGNGVATAYAHNSSLAVSVGQTVAQGEVVAYSGNTGHSTGPHLHFEVRINGSATDPFGYL